MTYRNHEHQVCETRCCYERMMYIVAIRKLSKVSTTSLDSGDGGEENIEETRPNSIRDHHQWFRTPFLYKISKYNLPEWRWILLGTIVSIAFGTTQPFFGLVFSNIYGSFDASEERRDTNAPVEFDS